MDFFISNAYAEAAPAGAGGDPMGIVFLIGMVVIFYFLLIRPQQKRAKEHRKLVEALSKGDEVVTSGGILGTITDVSEQYLTVQVADGVEMRMQKQAISTVLPKGSIKVANKE